MHVPTATEPEVGLTFEADRNRRIAERLPAAAVAFAVVLALAWVFEHRVFPERDLVYAALYALELLILIATAWVLRLPRFREHARPIAVSGAVGLVACITAYHLIVRSSGDVLALALLYVLVGSMVATPWGWNGQIFVSSACVAGFFITLAAGAQPVVPASMHALGLIAMGFLSVLGAAFLDRQQRSLFEQAKELRRSNEALETANQALQQANTAKNEFLASVSHELRTPLNIITGYVDLLLEGAFGPLPSEARDTVERIARTSRTLVFLISDLLDLSRVEAGRLTVQPRQVNLDTIFEDMRAYVEPRIAGKSIRFLVDTPRGVSVWADPHRLEQILINLLSNATKFTERGEIHLAAKTSNGGRVEISVRDTGCGIRPEEIPYLFEPFRQGSAGQRAGGVGIGLALSARLAAIMGGELHVHSEVGKGSVFTVCLRQAPPTAQAPNPGG